MRISDWSSDVYSSDLGVLAHGEHALRAESEPEPRVVAVAEPLAVFEHVAGRFPGSGFVVVLVQLLEPGEGGIRRERQRPRLAVLPERCAVDRKSTRLNSSH